MLDAAIILSLATAMPGDAASAPPAPAAVAAPAPAAGAAAATVPLASPATAATPAAPTTDTAGPAAADPVAAATPPAPSDPAPPAPAAAAAASPVAPDAAITDTPITTAAPRDPLRGFNRVCYAISQPIDRFILRPLALIYQAIIPKVLRDGIHNGLANLNEPVVFINDVLQLRFKRALHTAVRVVVNSTLGIGGLFDVARRYPISIADHPNGFGDTLGYYGVRPGPYVYLPVIGPSTLRDIVGGAGDEFAEPRLLSKILYPDSDQPFFRTNAHIGKVSEVTFVLGGLDERSRNDAALVAIKAQSVDPYASLRSSYLQDRAGEIAALRAKDGAAPAIPTLDDPLSDPADAAAKPVAPGVR